MGADPQFLFLPIAVFHHPMSSWFSLHGMYPLPFVLSRRLLQPYVDRSHPCKGSLPTPLSEVVLGARVDNTTLTYLNGFKRWRSWASKFPVITVLPAAPAYVALYLLSVLQTFNSLSLFQSPLYSICWAHDVAGLQSRTSHPHRRSWSQPGGGCHTRHPKNCR